MRFKTTIRFCGVYLLAAALLWVPAVSQAEMLTTQETLRSLTNDAEKREWLTSIVLRKEVQERLREHGLSKKESLSRVNSMTDEEVASAVDQIEEYVAAGDPLWRADGEKDAGQVFALVIGILVLGCLAFCWIIFL